MQVGFNLYGVQLELRRRRRGGYALRINGEVEVEGPTVAELAKAALPAVLEKCGERCRGAGVVVESMLRSYLKMALERLSEAWYDDLVARWREHYDEVDVVLIDSSKAWLYAMRLRHGGESVMVVKEYLLRNGMAIPKRLVYCGPAIVRTPRGYYIFRDGCLADIVVDPKHIYETMMEHARGKCYDVDVGLEVAIKIPAHRHEAVHVAGRLPFQRWFTGTIDWAQGIDLRCLMRTGNPEETAQMLKRREEILRKYYRPNYYPALAVESLHIAGSLAFLMRVKSSTSVLNIVYVYGAAGIGKSVLAHNLAQMWCRNAECKREYMPYNPGVLNETRLRNALDIEGPTFIADEQREKSVKELLNMLAAATSDISGMHAARYGGGVGYVFEVRRPVIVISNIPFSDAITGIPQAMREAVKRRALVIPWVAQPIDNDVAEKLINELEGATPPILVFVSHIYLKCRDRLAPSANFLEFAKAFWKCVSEVYGIDFSERLRALEWVESVQAEEVGRREVDELAELWTTIKAHYRTNDDREALLMLLKDGDVVVYTRDVGDRWGYLFRRICGQALDTTNEWQTLAIDVARCLYGIDVKSVDELEQFLGRIDVELVKKIAELKSAGKYPWIKAPSWAIPHKKRRVADVEGVHDAKSGVRRYDLIPQIFERLFVESEEGESEGASRESDVTSQGVDVGKEEIRGDVDTDQNYHVTTGNTTPTAVVTPPNGSTAQETAPSTAEKGEKRVIGTPGGNGGNTYVKSTSTNVNQFPSPYVESTPTNSGVETMTRSETQNAKPVTIEERGGEKVVTIDVAALEPVLEAVAKDHKTGPKDVWHALHAALDYFSKYHSVGSIRAVEDLKRVAKVGDNAVKAAIELMRLVGLLEWVEPGVYNYKAWPGGKVQWRRKANGEETPRTSL